MKKISLWLLIVLVSLGAFFTAKAATPDTEIVNRLYTQIVNWNVIKRMTCTNKDQIITTIVNNVKLNLVTTDKDIRLVNIKLLLQTKLQEYATTKCSQKWSKLISSTSIKSAAVAIKDSCQSTTSSASISQKEFNDLKNKWFLTNSATPSNLIFQPNWDFSFSKLGLNWFVVVLRPGGWNWWWEQSTKGECMCDGPWDCSVGLQSNPNWTFIVTCKPTPGTNPCWKQSSEDKCMFSIQWVQ